VWQENAAGSTVYRYLTVFDTYHGLELEQV